MVKTPVAAGLVYHCAMRPEPDYPDRNENSAFARPLAMQVWILELLGHWDYSDANGGLIASLYSAA